MIVAPPDWTLLRAGDACILRPPEGPAAGEIRYCQRLRPLRRMSAVVNEILEREPEIAQLQRGDIEPLITAEGEYAALTSLSALQRGAPVLHTIGAVFGDETLNVIDAIAYDAEGAARMAQIARRLVYKDDLNLGVRRRRFHFSPPAGWQALSSGLTTTLYPIDYPRTHAALVVHPAVPRDESPEGACAEIVQRYRARGITSLTMEGPDPVISDYGLHGQAWCMLGQPTHGESVVRDILIFACPRYLYALVLETTLSAHRDRFQSILPEVARSVRPIPSPSPTPDQKPGVHPVAHWAS